MTRHKILILGIHLFPLCVVPSVPAEDKFLVEMSAVSGQPPIVFSRGEKASLRGKRAMRPGDRIVTNARSRVLVHFRSRRDCRLLLEPNTSFEWMGQRRGGAYLAKLNRGTVKCYKDSCGLSLNFLTPAGTLRGRGAEFALKAYDRFTTVFLKKGRMRLLVGGQAVPLREMTRTTVSKTGGHRIAAVYSGDPRIPSLFSPPPLSGIPPASSKARFPKPRFGDQYISPVSMTQSP